MVAQLEQPFAQCGVRGRRSDAGPGSCCAVPPATALYLLGMCCGLAAHRVRTHLAQREPP
eukprot:scaffold76485_cov51-Phaeocystis_antarctica.AAC.3